MDKQTRKEALLRTLCHKEDDKTNFEELIDEMMFLETQLDYLKTLPFIKVHPDNPAKQKATPAARQYRELLSQYTMIIRVLSRKTDDDSEADSLLRQYFKNKAN